MLNLPEQSRLLTKINPREKWKGHFLGVIVEGVKKSEKGNTFYYIELTGAAYLGWSKTVFLPHECTPESRWFPSAGNSNAGKKASEHTWKGKVEPVRNQSVVPFVPDRLCVSAPDSSTRTGVYLAATEFNRRFWRFTATLSLTLVELGTWRSSNLNSRC